MVYRRSGTMIRSVLTGFALLLLAVCTAGPARGFQPETPAPVQSPAALTDSLGRAFQLIGEGKYQEARAELERAQTLAAGPCGDCLLGLSHVYASEKDWKRTKETVLKAIPLLTNPALARAYNQLGTAAFQSKGRPQPGRGGGRLPSRCEQRWRLGNAGPVQPVGDPADA